MLASCRFFKRPMAKIGSGVVLARSRRIPQAMKTIQARPESTKVEMMAALFHGYRLPPDSRAKTSSTEAARREMAPTRSTRLVDSRENLDRSRSPKLRFPASLLAGRKMAMMTIATKPGGPLNFSVKSASSKTQQHGQEEWMCNKAQRCSL
jgi:hypothetical protein